jgi:hypothetical protein
LSLLLSLCLPDPEKTDEVKAGETKTKGPPGTAAGKLESSRITDAEQVGRTPSGAKLRRQAA